jgi:radical SAM superfamily enzyme YgiQ (UPF0313 family)
MKVLIVSTNTLPAPPSGPAYLAGAARQAGHQVQVFESLFADDPSGELAAQLAAFQPDVVGVSIRLVHGDVQDARAPLGTRYIDLRPLVRQLVDTARRCSDACIVLGGPGFNYYAANWLAYLDVQHGIRGEGEEAFPLFLERLERGGDLGSVPGCVCRVDGRVRAAPPCPVADLNAQALPAYDLFDMARYAERRVTPAIFTKRGCAFGCTYCPYGKLEGWRYRMKTPERVLAEARHVQRSAPGSRIMICDNSFNVPRRHAEAICRAFISEHCGFEWGTGDLKPIGVTDAFCRLLEDSGCYYVNLAVESACDPMLRRMRRGYTARQVRASLEALSRSKVPFGASLMFGAPGETPETVAQTLAVMGDFNIPLGVWVTVGVYVWTDLQDIAAEARREGGLAESGAPFDGPVYLSPALSASYVASLAADLRGRPGYTVQVNRADRFPAEERA